MTMKQQKQAGFLLAKIHQLGGRVFARLMKKYGIDQINPAQGRIMFALWQQDDIPINDLAQRTKLGKSTLTSMLDRLEKAGLLKRVASKEDRRKILIQRTDKDKALESLYVRVSAEMHTLWYQGFTEPQMERFEADLQQILDNLSDFEKGTSHDRT